ncbi:MAG: Ig-like domain repeat protein [Nocardioides sp.]
MAIASASGGSPGFVLTGAEAPATPVIGATPLARYSAPSEPTWDDPVVVASSRRTTHTSPAGWHAGTDRLDDIPDAALAAYQRSAAVMDEASPDSHLRWTLLAAVGQVLTDHGRRGDHRVDDRGNVRPAIVGKPLRARGGQRLSDTEAGQLDDDRRFDRPVGPMLLAPSDWTVVGVDGDTDGKRNPQDLDDASLGVAVLLCHTGEDLRTTKGKRAALRRINDTPDFVRSVLDVDIAYRRQLRSDAAQVEFVPLTTLPSMPSLPEQTPPPRTAKPDRNDLARPPADSGIDPAATPEPPTPEPPTPEPQIVPTSTEVTATYDTEGLQISATAVVSADGAAPTGAVTFTLTGPGGVSVANVALAGGSATARFAVTEPGAYTVAAAYAGTKNHSGSEGSCVVQVVLPPSTEPSTEPSKEPAADAPA